MSRCHPSFEAQQPARGGPPVHHRVDAQERHAERAIRAAVREGRSICTMDAASSSGATALSAVGNQPGSTQVTRTRSAAGKGQIGLSSTVAIRSGARQAAGAKRTSRSSARSRSSACSPLVCSPSPSGSSSRATPESRVAASRSAPSGCAPLLDRPSRCRGSGPRRSTPVGHTSGCPLNLSRYHSNSCQAMAATTAPGRCWRKVMWRKPGFRSWWADVTAEFGVDLGKWACACDAVVCLCAVERPTTMFAQVRMGRVR